MEGGQGGEMGGGHQRAVWEQRGGYVGLLSGARRLVWFGW